ncbi:AIPR family protein [Micromonospora sp. DT43]|uniref:AIPR family protein n=1 Tax=Micromonospora sp. DT43 TaxID=3393440 RepID=UPI003CEAB66B
MEDQTDALEGLPLEVRQVRAALTQGFAGLLDLNDLQELPPAQRERIFLTRALAAKAVQLSADCTAAQAARAVTAEAEDHGFDAVLVSPATAEIWLIEAKWSDHATARLADPAIRQLLHRFQQLVTLGHDRIDAVLDAPAVRIHLVMAVLSNDGLSPEGHELLTEAAAGFNQFGELLDFRVLGVADFHAAVRRDALPAPVSVTATLSGSWHMNSTPYQEYLGAVAADEVAGWYEQHGERLFEQNVRYPLGWTDVNAAIVDSLLNEPNSFWYLNNGITVLCDIVRADFFARRAPGHPVRLRLDSARVVNGAQTVAAVYQAHEQKPEKVAEALVLVRILCMDGAPVDLAQRITQATNTQNRVEPRDFVALDPEQQLIRDDFALSLGKAYVLRRGEQVPAPAAGCSVAEAALALACAHPDAAIVARLGQDRDVLWHRGPRGVYHQLFGSRPGALQIWRSVRLLREVRDALAAPTNGSAGRDRGFTSHADLLVAHIAFQLVGSDGIDEPGDDWEVRMTAVAKLTGVVSTAVTDQLTAQYGRHALLARALRDEQSCRKLAAGVVRSMEQVDPPPARGRRPNAVSLLVADGFIKDGTQLVYQPGSATERDALRGWLGEAPERCLATWVNDDRRPLVWAVDEQRYSPTGLVIRIWEQAGWADRPVAVQGTRNWYLPGEGTLAELASGLRVDADAAGDGPGAR